MKEKELREIAMCGLCGKKIGKSGFLGFYRMRIQQYMLDPSALQRQYGLEMMLGGNSMIAQVMGMDEDMAKMMYENEITVCFSCQDKEITPIEIMEGE